jgi:putative membrane protein
VAEPEPAAGSLARDHLANERTLLAWLRTSANVMILGLAIAQLLARDSVRGLVAGLLLIGVGALGVFYGTRRYHRVNRDIAGGRVDLSGSARGPVVASVVLVVTVGVALVLLVA